MGGWYAEHVAGTGRAPALWLLVGFAVAFALTRTVTRRIRAARERPVPPGAPRRQLLRDVSIGGVHVHHQVWGMVLLLVTGMLQFRYAPGTPWTEVLALLFGVGAALVLDEFALLLHVDDVYWAAEGQRSVDAVLLTLVLGGALLLGTSPIGVSRDDASSGWELTALVVTHVGFALVCAVKGKLPTAMVGLVVPVVATVGALRLARPTSPWARRRYDGRRLARARERFDRYDARVERVRDLVGGRPA